MHNLVSAQPSTKATQQACPQCQAPLPVSSDYVTWCDRCGWNLQPDSVVRPRTIIETFYLAIGQKLSKGLFDSFASRASVKPGLTLSKILAIGVAALVHLF